MGAEFPASAPVNGGGFANVTFQNQYPGIEFEVRQVACWTGLNTSAGTVSLWKNGFLVAPSAALTPLPTGGVGTAAGGLPYIQLKQGEILVAMFTGCVPGDNAYANFMYEETYAGHKVYPGDVY